MKKIVAAVVVLLALCGSIMCSGLAEANFLGMGGVASPVLLTNGLYVSNGGDLDPGWYTASPTLGKYCKLTIVDVETFNAPKIVASYMWWPEGASFVDGSDDQLEEYTFPLWEGCFVLLSYYGDLEYDEKAETLTWAKFEDTEYRQYGEVKLEYVAPISGELSSLGNSQDIVMSENKAKDELLLYENDSVKITYSDFRVDSYSNGSAYLKTEWLIENKTDEIIDVTCDSITVNGCAVHIGKFADVPPKSKYLNEWTNGAEQFLKFGIDEAKTFSAVLRINNGEKIKSKEITLE